jgi:tRNA(fMet)-specific endonuclease VapC
VPVLPFDAAAAEVYARLPFRRGSFDRLIAAHALALDLVLVTDNVADYADVPGLKVENWVR